VEARDKRGGGRVREPPRPRETPEKISTIALTGMALVTIAVAKAMESTTPTLLATDEDFFDQHSIDHSAPRNCLSSIHMLRSTGLTQEPKRSSSRWSG
jgi:hypothetical protein